jgi:3'-phosphoadenosine 5'-phosphosulfate sulfotransferase (PAPS reductase)/FAD synthetase
VNNPYLIEGPALISFSGGRTSAYMLRMVLDAHGGTLPDDVHVCFANTGKEREETLRFVHECATRWGVRVNWLEFAGSGTSEAKFAFREVEFFSASRKGEPFDRLLEGKTSLPNWQARWCTSHLKVKVMHAFIRSQIGDAAFAEIVGLRADEWHRWSKMKERNERDGGDCRAPLVYADVTRKDVLTFWSAQDFDLGLEPGEGNCDLCFMKGARLRAELIRANPELAEWWAAKEVEGRFFDRRTRYATMAADVARSPDLFANDSDPDDEHDAECGLWCAGEAA